MKIFSHEKLQYINKQFSLPNLPYLVHNLPTFCVHSSKIKILHGPKEFYDELILQSSKVIHRISIASLYLGNGALEKNLVSCMSKRLDAERKLRINWLLDFTRASRGKSNSRTTLLPLIKKNESNCTVFLFHTPLLRGLYKWLMPEKFNEIIGLQHMKVYVFDNSVVISGANLSKDYFVNRQDRYFVINDCEELADFYESLIKEVTQHCFRLKADDTTVLFSHSSIHPYKGVYKDYCSQFRSRIRGFWESEIEKSCARLENLYKRLQCNSNSDTQPSDTPNYNSDTHLNNKSTQLPNTLLFPTVQMTHFDMNMDCESTLNFLSSVPEHSGVHLATGYFNLIEQYVDTILNTCNSRFNILCAHPKANGFFGAKSIMGGIPAAYTNLCKKFYKKIEEKSLLDRIKIFEYQKEGWTYHSKGLWYFPPSEVLPSTTLIGSPNFGYRSVYRDLETQLFVSTTCPSLRQEFHNEERKLFEHSTIVSKETFYIPERKVPLWVKLVTYFMKYFF